MKKFKLVELKMELMETFFVEIVTEERLACNVTSVRIGIAESKKKKKSSPQYVGNDFQVC